MTASFNLDPVGRITAGAIGEPGQRTFFLQATSAGSQVSLLLEKTQVAALARHIEALLDRLVSTHPGPVAETEPPADELELVGPVEPEFRVGSMSLGYDADRDLILLQCNEYVADETDDDEEEEASGLEDVEDLGQTPERGAVARFWATRVQMRALARHGTEVVAAGRPTCTLCGAPIDGDGHVCVALNGHRKDRDLS